MADGGFTTLGALRRWRFGGGSGRQPRSLRIPPSVFCRAWSTEGEIPGILFQDEQIVVFKDHNSASYRWVVLVSLQTLFGSASPSHQECQKSSPK